MPGPHPRVHKTVWPVGGFLLGLLLTLLFWRQGVPFVAADYLSLAVLAGMDSTFGGVRAGLERRFRTDVFLSGFLVNMMLAVALVWTGEKIGVADLYLAAVVTLGSRIFINLSIIRRHWLEKHPTSGAE